MQTGFATGCPLQIWPIVSSLIPLFWLLKAIEMKVALWSLLLVELVVGKQWEADK